jgi:DNA-binding winged helix-turn-helix (wHTH) protein
MSQQPRHIYEFGHYRLDAAEPLLMRDGEVVSLQIKVFDLLLALVERHGRLLEKDNLIQVRLARFFARGFSLNSRRTSRSGVAPSRRY